MKSLKSRVWEGENKRPFVDESWPVPIKTLLRRSWSNQINERPGFHQITKILRSECVRVRDGKEDGLEHTRRRSTFVFRGARGTLTSTKTSLSSKTPAFGRMEQTPIIEETEEVSESAAI
jgi:hypothetical protein